MSFLKARSMAKGASGKDPWPILLGMSGTPDPLLVYIVAHAAAQGRRADISVLPFGTLQQAMLSPGSAGEEAVYLLCPWDFALSLDWRSGITPDEAGVESIICDAEAFAARVEKRAGAAIVYLPAQISPLFRRPEDGVRVGAFIAQLAERIGARFLANECFSLASYFSSGCPVRSTQLSSVAAELVGALLGQEGPAKVLVTDLDDTIWGGIIGDLGPEGIEYQPEGPGYRHYFYQTLLLSLKNQGALLAVVSKNDPDSVTEVLSRGEMVLCTDDFVATIVSYEPKSAQINALAQQLNLGLDSFVFVDDSPIEIAEVSTALPQVRCLQFPPHEDDLIAFSSELRHLFRRNVATSEDRERTALYRRRLSGMAPSTAEPASIVAFLRSLDMKLTITDRTHGDRTRVVQLINKTHQFNINGRRWRDAEIEAVLRAGGRLFGATLTDRTGSHGEILSCLIDSECVVRAFVLSCRVFQRGVEFAFLRWLNQERIGGEIVLEFIETAKNTPVRQLFGRPAFGRDLGNLVRFDLRKYTIEDAAKSDTIVILGPE